MDNYVFNASNSISLPIVNDALVYCTNVVLLAYCGSRQLKKILVAGFMDVDGFLFHLADVNHFIGLTQNSQTI